MASAPNLSVGNGLLDHTKGVHQAPYTLRLATILTLPPPQSHAAAANGTPSSHFCSHPLSYSGQVSGTQPLHTQGKTQYPRYAFDSTEAFSYPTLGQAQANGTVSQKFQLPHNGFHVPPCTFPLGSELPLKREHLLQSGLYQPFASQNPPLPPRFPPQEGPLCANQMAYLPPVDEPVKPVEDAAYNHTLKIGSGMLANPKFSKIKLPLSHLSDPENRKPYVCTHDSCSWSFVRQSDLRRHARSHNAPKFHCPYWKKDPTCHRNGGSFSRLDVLKRHLRLVHYIKDKQKTCSGADPGWCRSCQTLFATSKMFISHCNACSRDIAPTEWKSNSAIHERVSAVNE